MKYIRSPYYAHKVARKLHEKGIVVLPKLIDYLIRLFFGCWLPHTVKIGRNFVIGYGGLGCIIHGESVIGNDVHMGANVTLGGNCKQNGVPIIEDNVCIGNGSQIIGPVRIGYGSIIGAGSVVTKNVPPKCLVVGNPGRVVRQGIRVEDYDF